MWWVISVTAFNWGIFLFSLVGSKGRVLELSTFFAFSTLLLIGPVAVQNGLMIWAMLTPGMAWAATIAVMLWILPVGMFAYKARYLVNGLGLIWYLLFLGLSLVSLAEVWNLGYLYSGLIFFWPIVAVVIPVGLAIHNTITLKTPQPNENGNAPE